MLNQSYRAIGEGCGVGLQMRDAPRGPPIALQAETLWQRALFATSGWRLLRSNLRQLAEAPERLSGAERAALQRALGSELLDHLRVQLDIDSAARLPSDPHIIIALHEGIADALCLMQLPLALRFVARQEIFEWPWIGPAIRRMRHIAVEPEQGAASYRTLVREVEAALLAQEHVLIFPQGCVLGIETAFHS
ncbi:MAG: lysophospholipid acyltransferase family protein, partial [Burkholderiaceae bacterium]